MLFQIKNMDRDKVGVSWRGVSVWLGMSWSGGSAGGDRKMFNKLN